MKRSIVLLQLLGVWVLLGLTQSGYAQANGKIVGKVTDKKTGEALIGVTVLIQNAGKGTVTDVEGRYTLSAPAGTYVLDFKYMGYQTKSISDVVIKTGNPVTLDIIMDEPSSKALQEVVIRGSFKQESINALLTFQKNTNTVAQVVSAESIKKSPDRNTGEVLKRVSGVSLQEGKYLVVRGLADRYNQATLNGALLASTEPDRKSFSFDIFPAAIVDNIIINKAATPEMPGEFAGGLVQVNTKDVPDKDFFQIAVGSGFNTQTISHDFYNYKGGKTDFLGLADGSRKMPTDFPSVAAINAGDKTQNALAGQKLNDIWTYKSAPTPINKSLQLSGGFNNIGSHTKGLGAIFSLNYNNQSRFSEIIRRNYDASGAPQFDNNDKQYATNILFGGLANFTYRSGNNKFSWKNSYNINSTDQTTLREGRDILSDTEIRKIRSEELSFVSNRLFNSQLIGDHFLRGSGIKIKWNLNYGLLNQDVPDLRRLKYTMNDDGRYYANIASNGGNSRNAGRFFSTLNEHVIGGSLDGTKSFKLWGQQQQIKIGGLYQRKDRKFDARGISISKAENAPNDLVYLPPSEILNKENYGPDKFFLVDLTSNADAYKAYANLGAGYVQFDNQIGAKFRLVWGARVEAYQQHLESRNLVPSNNEAVDVLPSFNLNYMQSEKVNIRLTASQTVSRPEFREISPFTFYDYERDGVVAGNPKLTRTKITNADLRYEVYPRAGEVFTVGLFYKFFDKPIESTYETGQGSPSYNYQNAKSATSYGAELEIRKKLDFIKSKVLEQFTVFTNLAVIKSNVAYPKDFLGQVDRPMQGQSPYLINAGLQYDNTASGTSATALFNVIGRRISQVGNDNVPPIWENPRPLLDFQLSQQLFKNAGLKLSITDILNKRAIYYWDQDKSKKYSSGSDLTINQFSYGTNVSIQFNYMF